MNSSSGQLSLCFCLALLLGDASALSPLPTLRIETLGAFGYSASSVVISGTVPGNIVNLINELGVVIAPTAINPNPTLETQGVTKVTGPLGLVGFSITVNSLVEATAYSFRLYARTSTETVYSEPGTVTTLSRVASLRDLQVSGATLTPAFSPNTTYYTASVPFPTASITVTPTAAHGGASLQVGSTVNGMHFAPVRSGSPTGPLSLTVGTNVLDIFVVAEDRMTSRSYRVVVSRSPGGLAQTISFAPPSTVYRSQSPLRLHAVATSGLPVTFAVTAGPATIFGDDLILTGQGTIEVTASQPGGGNYAPAPPVTRLIQVEPEPTSLTLINLNQVYDGQPKPIVALGANNVLITYIVGGREITSPPINAGTYPVKATAGSVTRTGRLVIGKATLTITPDDQQKLAGLPTPPLSWKISGFLGSDDVNNSLSRAPALRTTAGDASPGGMYPILASGASATNYDFLYQPGTLFVTSFVGGYEGFLPDEDWELPPWGKLEATVAATGRSFSAKLFASSETAPIRVRGPLEIRPTDRQVIGFASITLRDGTTCTLQIAVSEVGSSVAIDRTGTGFLIGEGRKLAQLTNVAFRGQHTAILKPALPASATTPEGSGWAIGQIAANGRLTLRGRLGDSTPFTSSLALTELPHQGNGYLLFAQPYLPSRTGSRIAGEFGLEPHRQLPGRRHSPASTLRWIKTGHRNDPAYRDGFGPVTTMFSLEPWLPPIAPGEIGWGVPLAERLNLTAPEFLFGAQHSLTGTEADNNLPRSLWLNLQGRVMVEPSDATGWQVTMSRESGIFRGSFNRTLRGSANGAQNSRVTFSGVLRQAPEPKRGDLLGAGHFVLPNPKGESMTGDISFVHP